MSYQNMSYQSPPIPEAPHRREYSYAAARDARLHAEHKFAEAAHQAGPWLIAAYFTAMVFFVCVVLYGLNHQRTETGEPATAAGATETSTPAPAPVPAPQAQPQQKPQTGDQQGGTPPATQQQGQQPAPKQGAQGQQQQQEQPKPSATGQQQQQTQPQQGQQQPAQPQQNSQQPAAKQNQPQPAPKQ